MNFFNSEAAATLAATAKMAIFTWCSGSFNYVVRLALLKVHLTMSLLPGIIYACLLYGHRQFLHQWHTALMTTPSVMAVIVMR